MTTRRLSGLDTLRGIAALAVMGYHLPNWVDFPYFAKGYLAVDFFFMLSGYVLARTYEHRLAEDLPPARFLLTRWKRLWPTMALASLVALPYFANYPAGVLAAMTIAGLLFIPLPQQDAFPLNGPQWSIFFELFANTLHALGLRVLKTSTLIYASAGLAGICAIIAHRLGSLDFGGGGPYFWVGIPRVLLSYIIGIVLWRTWRDRPPFALPPAITLCLFPAVVLLSWAACLDAWPFDLAFVLLVCPLLIGGGLKFEAGAIGALIGEMSFPFYAFHAPMLAWSVRLGFGIGFGIVSTCLVALGPKLWKLCRAANLASHLSGN